MKKVILLLLSSFSLFAQVGINTTDPNATLDINGDLMIRTTDWEGDMAQATNSILVTSGGIVKKVPLKDAIEEIYKTAVKGSFNTSSTISISLGGGSGVVPFNNEEFDINDEFDTTTHTFTAKQDGIYRIYVQIKQNNLLISTNYGVRIMKNGTVIQKNSFANLSVAFVDVTSPIRSIQTLVELNEEDEITFEIESSLTSVSTNLVGSSASSFFTIERIR
ncbi:MAG: C1q-like domain-containing protein [Patiriisocius sp.]|uniref:C1q-like domain-containing protein n=1 Tax=Patiriisocius sp. TaxID=2822396 RepID=UPI003EF1A5E0